MRIHRRGLLTIAGAGTIAIALGATLGGPGHASAATPPGFALHQVGPFGGESSITSDSNGVLYDTSPSGPETFRSNNQGNNWTAINSPDNNSGDDCLNTDQQNSLYWCNLGSMTVGNAPLQADVFKSTTSEIPAPITSCTTNCTWHYGNNAVTGGSCSTSCNPFGVDRQWVGSSITGVGASVDTAHAEVVLMYHDFYGPSHIWVNISTDGGATFGTAQEVLSGANFTANPNGSITAEGYTFCNTVPSGVYIVPPGKPHAGRMYVAWIAADPAQDGSGCNITMVQSFHTAWIAYSDPGTNGIAGAQGTWIPQEAFDSGIGHDMSTPFVAFTNDNQGNPYLAFNTMDVTSATNVATCAADAANNMQQLDPTCSYNTYVVWCQCGGSTVSFDGGGASLPADPNSAASPYEVKPAAQGTDQFATIAAGDPGKVDVSYLHTPETEPTDAFGKFLPLGCAGPGTYAANTPPSNYPPRCHWNLVTAQSLNLTASTSAATWAVVQATTVPMHYGDICNLGIFCAPGGVPGFPYDPRHLLDFNQETVDPTTGCAHIAYEDDNAGSTYGDPNNLSPNGNKLVSADQNSGPAIIGTGSCGLSVSTPEAPFSALLLGGGAAVVAVVGIGLRRQRSNAPPALS